MCVEGCCTAARGRPSLQGFKDAGRTPQECQNYRSIGTSESTSARQSSARSTAGGAQHRTRAPPVASATRPMGARVAQSYSTSSPPSQCASRQSGPAANHRVASGLPSSGLDSPQSRALQSQPAEGSQTSSSSGVTGDGDDSSAQSCGRGGQRAFRSDGPACAGSVAEQLGGAASARRHQGCACGARLARPRACTAAAAAVASARRPRPGGQSPTARRRQSHSPLPTRTHTHGLQGKPNPPPYTLHSTSQTLNPTP